MWSVEQQSSSGLSRQEGVHLPEVVTKSKEGRGRSKEGKRFASNLHGATSSEAE